MNIQDCYRILGVSGSADLDAIKSAFRKLAFKYHPDLNPAPDAAQRFREINEAYVLLTRTVQEDATAGRQTEAEHGPKAKPEPGPSAGAAGGTTSGPGARAGSGFGRWSGSGASGYDATGAGFGMGNHASSRASFTVREEEVLRDLLKDRFARQVFEDIYRQVRRDQPGKTPTRLRDRRLEVRLGGRRFSLDLSRGVWGSVKHWFTHQLDEELTLNFPISQLQPGRSLRISVHQKFSREPRLVSVTLPPDFAPGRPIRLRGLGKKLGPLTGDLILRLMPR